jgi:hypothetical protein
LIPSCRNENFSSRYPSNAKNAEPMTTPARLRSPPTTVMITNTNARLKLQVSGETNVSLKARSAPASPANAPDNTNANKVRIFTLTPKVAATLGFSRNASSARPDFVRIIRQSIHRTIARNARQR